MSATTSTPGESGSLVDAMRRRGAIKETDVVVGEAMRRYHIDAEFHAEVYRAVAVAVSDYPFLNESERTFARGHALMAAAIALHLRDENGSKEPRQ